MKLSKITMIGPAWILVISILFFIVRYPALNIVGYLVLLFFGIVISAGGMAIKAVRA